MHLRMTGTLLAASLLVSTSMVADGAGEEQKPPVGSVEEQVSIHLLEIPVVALDRKENPITDLRAEEIVVKLRGRRQRVAFLQPAIAPAEALPPELADVRLHVDAPGGAESVVPAVGREPRYIVLLVDVEHDSKLNRPRALESALRFVRNDMQPGDFAAVLSYDGDINLETSFTNDAAVLAEALSKAWERSSSPSLTMRRNIEDLLRALEECGLGRDRRGTGYLMNESCVRDLAVRYVEEHKPDITGFLDALSTVIRYADALDAPATVLAISHGVATRPELEFIEAARAVFNDTNELARMQITLNLSEDIQKELDALKEQALRSGVTFYFIDRNKQPVGLRGARQRGFYYAGFSPIEVAHQQPQRTNREVARATGGDLMITTDVGEGLRQALEMERGRYLLGVYLDRPIRPREFKSLSIETTRRKVRLRRGIAAYHRPPKAEPMAGRFRFGKTRLLDPPREGRFVPFAVEVPPRQLGYVPTGRQVTASLTLHVVVATQQGRVITGSYHFLAHSYPRDVWEQGQEGPLVVRGWVEAPEGDYRLVARIRNAKTGRGGEIATAIRIVTGDGSS